MPTWIDFKELRAKLKMESLLRFYQIEIKRKGEQHQGFCPLPNHKGGGSSPTFSANLERGIFQCFGCGAKGSVLDFAILMEGTNPNDGRAVRKVALKLRRELVRDIMPVNSKRFVPKPTPLGARKGILPVLVNAPLDFELKDLETDHLWLLETGLTAMTIAHFGIGYCSRGMLKGRFAIPLHDANGQLVGYAGQSIDPDTSGKSSPEYLFPNTRERNGKIYEFRKSALLYNRHRIRKLCEDLVVVSWFPSVWWLHEHGFAAIAVMGSECSEEQIKEIVSCVKPSGRLWLMPDGGKEGDLLAQRLLLGLSPHRFTRWVKLVDGQRPEALSAEEINSCFTT